MELKKQQTTENMAISIYSLASIGFHDQEYFESIFMSFLDSNASPHLDQLAMLAQGSAILRRSEYTPALI